MRNLLLEPVTPSAQPETASPPDRATAFQPVQGGGEHRNGAMLMVEAYVVLWVVLMAWLLLLWRRQRGLVQRLDDLERTIDRAAEKAARPASGA